MKGEPASKGKDELKRNGGQCDGAGLGRTWENNNVSKLGHF